MAATMAPSIRRIVSSGRRGWIRAPQYPPMRPPPPSAGPIPQSGATDPPCTPAIDRVEIPAPDDPVQMDVYQVEARRRAPVTHAGQPDPLVLLEGGAVLADIDIEVIDSRDNGQGGLACEGDLVGRRGSATCVIYS
jgi:hypothetical protein